MKSPEHYTDMGMAQTELKMALDAIAVTSHRRNSLNLAQSEDIKKARALIYDVLQQLRLEE